MNKERSNKVVYFQLLGQIKQQIRSAQAKAALAVNSSLIQLYWNMGKMIAENQALFEGRTNYVNQLASDLRSEFPGVAGFSRANLFYIRKFFRFYSVQQAAGLKELPIDLESVQQPAAPNRRAVPGSVQQVVGEDQKSLFNTLLKVPWGHHVVILDKIKEQWQAIFYLQQTVEYNWSRAVLTLQIEQDLFSRQGRSITNFKTTLPEQQALLAGQILKDPYNFGFLTLEPEVQELEIEKRLTEQITKFLLELGKGFAFIGRQYQLEVGEKEYRLDLLFYHIRLRCFVVIDLKTGDFEPEFAGKMNFYLSIVDDQLRTTDDQPSIGIILCKGKSKLVVEYALRGMNKPIGVSEFTMTRALPKKLKGNMPTVEEFENELNKTEK